MALRILYYDYGFIYYMIKSNKNIREYRKNQFRINHAATMPRMNKPSAIAKTFAWIICPMIILFSHVPILNLATRSMLAIFICWVFIHSARGINRLYFPPPMFVYLLWTVYSLLPSIFAQNQILSIQKWIVITLLGLVSFGIANAIVWGRSATPWIWAYLFSALLSYLSSYLPIQSFLEVDYETETLGRNVGTLTNANTFGRAMVQGVLLALLINMQQQKQLLKFILVIIICMLSIAVLGSGSRTALIGLVLALVSGAYCAGIKAIFKPGNILFFGISIFAGASYVLSQPERFTKVFDRMNILFSFLGISEHIETKEHSLDERSQLMSSAFQVWLDNPMGIGLDNYRIVGGVYAHSNFMELLASVGLIGLMIYYFGYYLFYKWLRENTLAFKLKSQQTLLILAIAISVIMDVANVSYYAKTVWLFNAILAGQAALWILEYKERNDEFKK